MELTTEFSSWFLILCAVLAGLYTFFLYGKNKQNAELPPWVVQLLSVLRFFTVFILSALLLNPLIQNWVTQTERPLFIIAQDVSASVVNNADSVYYKSDYISEINQLKEQLSSNYKVVTLNFGEEVIIQDSAIQFTAKRTNFAKVFDEIEARYAGSNIGALILASDGLFNVGANPDYYNFKQNYPVYTVGLGDTTQKSDLAIAEILTNEIVYLGNSFPIEVSVTASLLKGKTAQLQVFNNGKQLTKRSLKITQDQQFFSEKFVFKATEEGTQRYVVKLTTFENELNTINNSSQSLIDVLDNRDKVLIIANAPHPDIAAIRGILSEKESLEIDVTYIDELTQTLDAYNLIIAHGFKSGKNDAIWAKVWESEIPMWVIMYGKSNLRKMSQLNPGFIAPGSSRKVNRISPSFNKDFSAFKISQETKNYLSKVPPLHTPFGEITDFDASQVLFYQKLGSVETNYPLAYFSERNETKTAWLFGEGLWQWKLYDYQENQSNAHFGEVVWKTVQYLSVKEDKSRFRVKINKRFNENENIRIKAEFYNKSYQLINEPEVKLVVTDQEGKLFNFVFNPVNNTYSLEMGRFEPGVYAYKSTVLEGGTKFSKSGSFIVNPVNVEWTTVSADFDVLKNLSDKTGGKFYVPSQLAELARVFDDESKFPSITYKSERKQSLLHEKWIFFLLLLLLTAEWLMRKYKGRY